MNSERIAMKEAETEMLSLVNGELLHQMNSLNHSHLVSTSLKMAECYLSTQKSLEESQHCAREVSKQHGLYRGNNENRLLVYQRGLEECTLDCQNNLKESTVVCYTGCFRDIKQLVSKNL